MTLQPLPGEPATVAAEARRMTDAAERMRRAAATLRELADRRDYRSEAVDALRSNAHDVSAVMTKAAVRYQGTGEALAEYAPALEAAQQQAKTAIATLGITDVGNAQASLRRAELDPWEHATLSDEEKTSRAVAVAEAKAELAQQKRIEATALALHADAVRDVEAAAQRAVSRIQDANEMSGLNDSFWDDWNALVDNHINPALENIAKVLDVVSDIVGIIALILAFIPGLQPLAGALAGLSLAMKAISLLITTLQVLMGKKSWGDLVAKAVVLAISAVLKGGIGKAVGKTVTKAKADLSSLRQALPGGKGGIVRISPDTLARSVGNMTKLKPGDEGYDAAIKSLLLDGLKLEVKYGAQLAEGDTGATYEVDYFSLATDAEYRAGLTPNDVIGEGISTAIDLAGKDPVQTIGKDLGENLIGGAFDHFTGGGTFGTADFVSEDVTNPIAVDFSGVDAQQILADHFTSAAVEGKPARAALHTAGVGG